MERGSHESTPVVSRDSRYESFQRRIAEEIASAVRSQLASSVTARDLQDLVERISFEVCSIIDGSAMITVGNDPVLPVLAFSESEVHPERLLVDLVGIGSYMHELLPEITDAMFES
jgi:hypothetical protein